MISKVNFGSNQNEDPRVKQNYPPSTYYYPTRPVSRDQVNISNANGGNQPSQRAQYPQQIQYPPNYKSKQKSRMSPLQTVGTVTGIIASAAMIYYFAGERIMQKFVKEHTEDVFRKIGDEIPAIENLKSVNKKAKDFLTRIIDSAKVPEDILKDAGNPAGDRSILLYGQPGTGKSFFAKVAAKSMDANYTEIDFSQIASPYVGQASKNIRDKADVITRLAKENPTVKHVVTLNEIDALIQEDPMGASHTAEVRSTMLNILEQLQELPNVLIVGTTNRNPKGAKLDKASVDRFHTIFEIPLPDKTCLVEAARAKLLKVPAAKDFLENGAKELEDFSKQLEEKSYSHRKLDQLIEKSKTIYMIEKNNNRETKFTIDHLKRAYDTQVEGLSK